MKKPNRKYQQNNSVEKPEMTDESGARYRAQLIASGQLVEGGNAAEEELRLESVKQLRETLIREGFIRPGAGLRKLKKQRPQNKRVLQ